MPQLPNLPSIPGTPDVPALPSIPRPPSLPGAGAAAATRARGAPTAGVRLNRSTAGTDSVASLPKRPDPVGELRFLVDLGKDLNVGRFRECTGLAAEIEVKDYNEGGVNHRVHKLPTRIKYPNLVLKRGITFEDALLKWLWTTQNKPEPIAITVSLVGPEGKPVRQWSFADAYPIKWTGPNLNASSNQVATEALEIVHGGFQTRV